MDQAVSSFLQYDVQQLQTDSFGKKEWSKVKREEQISSDRRGKRDSYVVEHSETACTCCLRRDDNKKSQRHIPVQQKSKPQSPSFLRHTLRPWRRLDQALRA